ncbi:hypothetical protein JT358_05540 [Micrococcales bacterium 31B]|nr:hypothetical protein [Micrococcales bacterium 31B]
MKLESSHLDLRVLPTAPALAFGLTCFFLRQRVRHAGSDDALITRMSLAQSPQPVMPLNAWDVTEHLESHLRAAGNGVALPERAESYRLDLGDSDLSEQFFSPRFVCDPAEITRGSQAEWLTLGEVIELAAAAPAWVLGSDEAVDLRAYETFCARLAAHYAAPPFCEAFCDPISPAADAPQLSAIAAGRRFFVGTHTRLTEYETGKRGYALLTCQVVPAPRWYRRLRREDSVILCHRVYLTAAPGPIVTQCRARPLADLPTLASEPEVNWWPEGEFARRVRDSIASHDGVRSRDWPGLILSLTAPRVRR